MTDSNDDEHYPRVIVCKGDQRSVPEVLLALLTQGPELGNLRTPETFSHLDNGFKPYTSPLGARVYVRPGSADELVLSWTALRCGGHALIHPRPGPTCAVHPGLVAELMYASDEFKAFARVVAESKEAFDYVLQLQSGGRAVGLDDMQALARSSRVKRIALEIVQKINNEG